jgi:hypothetical protein
MTKKKAYDPLKSIKKVRRKLFFEKGGTPSQWIRPNKIVPNKKKQKDKDKCRTKITEPQ